MKTQLSRFLAATLTLAAGQSQAQTINFDDVASGTIVDTHYDSLLAPGTVGVAFTDIGPVNGGQTEGSHVYAMADPDAASQPNGVSVFPGPYGSGGTPEGARAGFSEQWGVIKATFSSPVQSVSIAVVAELWEAEVFGTTMNRPYMKAYDSGNNLIGTVQYYPQSDIDQFSYLNVTGPERVLTCSSTTANIKYVLFSSIWGPDPGGDTTPVAGVFDNLTFNPGPSPLIWTPPYQPPGFWNGRYRYPIHLPPFVLSPGWYNRFGIHGPGGNNYIAGNFGDPDGPYHDYFAFNIRSLSGPVINAELQINTYGISSPGGQVTYQLSRVIDSAATVEAEGTNSTIYADLGNGIPYGTRTFLTSETNRMISIPLNPAFVSAINAATNSSIVIGGSVVTGLNGDTNGNYEYVFGNSLGNSNDAQLVLTLQDSNNIPSLVGYFTDNNSTDAAPSGPIVNAGFTPLQITNISTQSFPWLSVMMIDESSNTGISAALSNRLSDIQNWVSGGGRLIVHDRSAGNLNPNPFLFGTPGLGTVRLLGSDVDVVQPANTLVTAGPLGIVDNYALDGGCSSEHGYIPAANLPPGARAILSMGGNSNQIVAFYYPLGSGFVYYSTIPLDYYLDGGDCGAIATNGPSIYAPNVVSFMQQLNPLVRLFPPGPPVGGNLQLVLANLDGSPITPDNAINIQIYSAPNLSGNWAPVPTSTVLSNGWMQVNGLSVTNSPVGLFRAGVVQ